jgi:hypothetical protein
MKINVPFYSCTRLHTAYGEDVAKVLLDKSDY